MKFNIEITERQQMRLEEKLLRNARRSLKQQMLDLIKSDKAVRKYIFKLMEEFDEGRKIKLMDLK